MKEHIKMCLRYPGSFVIRLLCQISTCIVSALIVFILAFVLFRGVPELKPSLFALEYTSENVSLLPALFNTLVMTLLSLMVAVPLGVGGGIFLVEYSGSNSKWVRLIRLTAETLSGIPSILFGLFGMMLFVIAFDWHYSLLSGSLTLALMILPLILRTTEEALRAVPLSYREGSFGLGAGKFRTVCQVVLPPAMPGILSGIILAIGRVVGETAALIFTAGTVADFPSSIFSSGRTLAVHMYVLASEGLHVEAASATAVVLLAIVFLMNTTSNMVAKKMTRGTHE